MISKNLSLNNNSIDPFLLAPYCKAAIWGGQHLHNEYGKVSELDNIAESWECSTHPDGPSIVASGRHKGELLTDVLKKYPEYLGTHQKTKGELPILVKFIDAQRDLSIQVHPDDEYAKRFENGQLGKTEMWYSLKAAQGAKIIHGFRQDMDKPLLRKALEDGSVEKYMNAVTVRPNDVFFINAGTVHGIGAGNLIAEIQESSNLTYRLYDYNRVDKNGKRRELHIDKALDVATLESNAAPRQPMRVLKYKCGSAAELLCRCKYFQVERVLVNTEAYGHVYKWYMNDSSFQVILCIEGSGKMLGSGLRYKAGDCIFCPAGIGFVGMEGNAQLLKIQC